MSSADRQCREVKHGECSGLKQHGAGEDDDGARARFANCMLDTSTSHM